MYRSTIPAGRWLGVDLRIHMALPALLLVAGAASLLETGAAARGIVLWLALLLAVLTREGARALALVWSGRPPRGIVLFPFGGVVLLSPSLNFPAADLTASRASAGSLTLVPLLANVAAAGLLACFSYAVAPGLHLLTPPWISLHFLLRSAVWTQAILGIVNLLPAATLPSRQLARSRAGAPGRASGPSLGLANSFGLLLMLLGFVSMNLWFVAFGCLLLLTSQMAGVRRGGVPADLDQLASFPVRDVMLTGYATLANSDILTEALDATGRSGEETLPVLQGDRLVGVIGRSTMAGRLRSEGDGYVQRDMLRALTTASPDEPVSAALRRAAALGAGGVVAVADEAGRVLGILTPRSLAAAARKRCAVPAKSPVQAARSPAPAAEAQPCGERPSS